MSRLLLLLALLGSLGVEAAPAPSVRRLALLVGVNDGGAGRSRLRYAATDAQSFSQVLGELGGVAASDRLLLLETGRAGLLEGFSRLGRLVESSRSSGASRVEVLLYYSGHSDEEGLLLQGERLTYGELRRALEALHADVRIAVLDSCASGAFARRKGGSPRPAFLVDTGSRVSGQAILTSSGEDEASQESDRLGGSFFTHHLVSGLRGAADITGDGRVTLNEAYQFAFHETLSRTERTRYGAQHPAYNIELAGTGDVVMTDLRSTSAALVLTDSLKGRLFVRDAAGRLVLELLKHEGRPTELGLAPGRYQVRRELDGALSEASFVLTEGRRTTLATESFTAIQGELTVSRGVTGGEDAPLEATPRDRVRLAFNLGLVPGVSTNVLLAGHQEVENQWALGLMNHAAALAGGASLGLLSNAYDARASGFLAALGANVVGGRMTGVQTSMAFNHARELTGLQLSLINVAGDVTGAQVGLINVAGDVRGTQVGLVNVAREMRGVPLGLLSLSRPGRFYVELWASDIQLANVGVKLGGRHFYTTFTAGLGPDTRLQHFSFGWGLGAHLPLPPESRFWVDVDAVAHNLSSFQRPLDGGNQLLQGRVMVGVRLLSRLSVFIAPTYNVYFALTPEERWELVPLGSRERSLGRDGTLRHWPGVQVGLRL
ncbi:MAG: caspase family protein [Cystobacter sp.]